MGAYLPTHIGTYRRHLGPWRSCNPEGLPIPAKESCVAEIFTQDGKTTGKARDDR